ncbi:MAG TPA: hypothetical protein VG448_00665 [Solirubrobacterales bacterium]|nr:hypothetical protein [Solirubrobacterales bacterium]
MAATLRQRTLRALFGALMLALAAGLLLLPVASATATPKHDGKAAKAKCKRSRAHRAHRSSRACAKGRRSKPKLQIESEFTGATTTTEPVTDSKATAPGHTETHKKPSEQPTETTTESPPPTTEPEPTPVTEPEPEPTPEPGPEPQPEPEVTEPPAEPAPEAESAPEAEPATEATATTTTPFRFFSPTSFWNTEPGALATLDPESSSLTAAFRKEIEAAIAAGTGPWINTTNYSVPIVRVAAGQPKVRVRLVSNYSAPYLQAAWEEVPIPPTAKPSEGTDATLVVYQPSSDKLWEFWHASHTETGWQAAWGGAIQNASKNWGAYNSEAWTGAKPWWGSSASSLSIAGGLITLEDLERGSIDHALALAIPNVRAGVYSSPAQRTDGASTSALSLPEGAHLRLDPSLDLEKLKLPPLTLEIARAAQRYGIFVRDRAKVIHFFAQDPSGLAINPYIGKTGYFEGQSPAKLLSSFPWSHLQLLRMDLHSTS